MQCKACLGKGQHSVFKGEGGYSDFGSIKYIETKRLGVQYIPCKRCNGTGKENTIGPLTRLRYRICFLLGIQSEK